VQLLVNFLANSINEYKVEDVEDHKNTPGEPQVEGVPVDEDDLEPGGSQQHSTTMGSHYNNISILDFNDNYLFSPPPEPGSSRVPCAHQVFEIEPDTLESLSCVPHAHQVFEVEPDSDLDNEEEGEEEPEQGEDTYIWFQLDVGSEGEGDDDEVWIEDPRLAGGEGTCWLDVKRELDDIGLMVFSRAEKDNIKAMALKVGNQLTRKAYKGVQKLTKGHMVISSKYITGRILEHASGLSFQVYNCCSNSCVCFTGEFESLTACPLCSEQRYDGWQKAWNQFHYIPIIPCLQAMFWD
jgi:hypothetical protein